MHVIEKDRWLILAYWVNVDGMAASQTITDRLPFLSAKGIDPFIISASLGTKDRTYHHYQVFSLAPSGIRFEMRYVIKKYFQNRIVRAILKTLNAVLCLPFYAVEKLFIHLDSHWSWFATAFLQGLFVIFKYRPRIIYSTGGPTSAHVAGYLLSRLFGMPWMAELHDPLIVADEKKKWRKWQQYHFKIWLEKLIFKHAAIVVYFTENAHKNAVGRNRKRKGTYVIRPGANPPDFSSVVYRKRDSFHLAYFGSISKGRNLKNVIRAVHELISDRPELEDLISFEVYGADLDPVSKKALSDYPLGKVFTCHGRLERQRALGKMKQSDLLVLLHRQGVAHKEIIPSNVHEEYIPSKVYEYMLTHRPILACSSKTCELGQLLLENGYYVADGDSYVSIKKGIMHYAQKWQESDLSDIVPKTDVTVMNAVNMLSRITQKNDMPTKGTEHQ